MRPQELNLLMVFDAIMTERSITRAADRLAMTQPAVSNAVSRMRTAWKDELFVKDGRNIQPTVHARNLWSQIKEPIHQLNEAVDPSAFDPRSANRTFRIAVSDIAVDMAWLALRQLIEREAPNINIYAIPYTMANAQQMLIDAKVDLLLGAQDNSETSIGSEFLFAPEYVCAMRQGHPLAKAKLSLEEFAAADHLLVSLSGDNIGFSDQVLSQHGLSRRVAMTVNHFSSVSPILENTDLISIVPSGAVEKAIVDGTIAATKPPFEMPPTQISLSWHKRQNTDAGLIWLRQNMGRIVTQAFETHAKLLNECLCKGSVANC